MFFYLINNFCHGKCLKCISYSKNDINSLIETKQNNSSDLVDTLFNYSGIKFSYIKVNGNFYFTPLKILNKTNSTIELPKVGFFHTHVNFVSEEYRIKLEDIFNPVNLTGLENEKNLDGVFNPSKLAGLEKG